MHQDQGKIEKKRRKTGIGSEREGKGPRGGERVVEKLGNDSAEDSELRW